MKLLVNTAFSQRGVAAWLLLLFGLLATIGLWRAVLNTQHQRASAEFELHNREVLASIEKRLQDHEQILLSGAGLLDASEQVGRAQWRLFVERLKLHINYPGIQGVGFTKVIERTELDTYQQMLRAEGRSEQLRPNHARDFYTAILYLEPDDERNKAAFGYDMFTERVRRTAMQQAVEENSSIISGKVTLQQEIYGRQQAGFLMYVPVYHKNRPLETATQRWQALMGFVYSPYRMDDLMHGLLGNRELMVDFTIHDGNSTSDDSLLYNSAFWHIDEPDAKTLFKTQYVIPAYGRPWLLSLTSRPAFEKQFSSELSWSLPLLGVAISVLLFFLVLVLLSRQLQALQLAERMTKRRNESEARFHQLFLHLGQGVLIYDANGVLLDANPAALELMALSLAQIKGQVPPAKDWHSSPAQPLPPAAPTQIQAALSGKEMIKGAEVGFWHGDLQAYLWCNLDVYPQLDDNQQVKKLYLVLSDITERKRVAKMKDEFVSTVSHELRTPLTSISGALDLLCNQVLDDKAHEALKQHMLKVAADNSKRLTLLINDLLDLEKIAAGGMVFNLSSELLLPQLQQSIEVNQVYGASRGISIALSTEAEDQPVLVDVQRLAQVLSNLLSNAIKFSPDGAVVTLTLQRYLSFMRISVCDKGAGIPLQFRPMIFQKFSQADASNSRRQQGTGLGLAICKELVEHMNGRISFVSEEGRGSCFYVDLPVAACNNHI
jgi:PAS domain S-box-containing protein